MRNKKWRIFIDTHFSPEKGIVVWFNQRKPLFTANGDMELLHQLQLMPQIRTVHSISMNLIVALKYTRDVCVTSTDCIPVDLTFTFFQATGGFVCQVHPQRLYHIMVTMFLGRIQTSFQHHCKICSWGSRGNFTRRQDFQGYRNASWHHV